ncbi:MAG: PLxRFG domain-containing protein [Moraxellaceae bacterium]|nr:PLxRFG domain-containing protein [Moraxellaceae bacterium]
MNEWFYAPRQPNEPTAPDGGGAMFSRTMGNPLANDVVGNQGGRSADDSAPGAVPHPFSGFTREQFLGNPKIAPDSNAKDLVPQTYGSLESVDAVPFLAGNDMTAKYSDLSASVYNAKGQVIATYSSGDTLVVDKKYRRQGIGSELVYQWRMRNPNSKTAATRTKKSQALQEKVWDRIRSERALHEARAYQNESTAPDSGGAMFSRTMGNPLASAANNTQEALKNATVTDLLKQFGNRLGDFRGLGLQTLGRRQLVDLYAGDLPQMESYSRMVAQMDADKNESGAEADALATDWGKLKDERQLAELMHDATLAQIDPDKAFVEGDNRDFYDALKHGFDRLTPEAKAAYRKARDMYSEHNDKVRDAIRERIMRSEMSSAKKQALLTKMEGEFFKKVKGVYFPLARFGQYVTIVKSSSGDVISANRSETMNEAEATRKILLTKFPPARGFKVSKVLKDKEFNAARDGVGRGFMADLFETLDKTNAGEELTDAISQLYLAALPDLSWAKHGIHRKGTPGFSQDARRAFAQNMFHGARYLAKLRYADRLQTNLDDMQEHIASKADDDGFDSVKAQQVVDEMVKRHDTMMNPQTNPISTALTSFGFVFHLGLSPASALVNLSQTALVAYPVMGAKWGFGKASAALMSASQQAASNKNDISKALNGDELEAYNEAVRAGVIDVTMAHDLAGIAQGEDSKVSAKIRPVMKAASFLFHHAEKFNRQVTFVASYRLARETGAGFQAAYDQAVKATYDGHFDYSASNRPRVMQGNVAKVVLLFKQYAQNMIYTLTRQAQLSLNAATPAERAEARKALGGLLVSHALAAGALGLPMVGMLLSAASAIGGDDDEPWDAKVALQNMLADTLGKKPAEVFAHGLSRLTPWDISGRVGLDKLLLPDVQEGLEGADAVKNWMAAALGPVAGIAVNAGKGMQDMANGQYARGLESMLPSALRSPLKAYRYGTEGNIDKSGVAINDEIGAAGVAGQALGFSPSEARLAQEGKSAIYSADRAIQARRSSLTRQFALAAMAKDQDGMTDARKDIARFNEKNPKARITPINLMQSVRARRKRIEQAEQGVYLPKKRQDAIEAGRFALAE